MYPTLSSLRAASWSLLLLHTQLKKEKVKNIKTSKILLDYFNKFAYYLKYSK